MKTVLVRLVSIAKAAIVVGARLLQAGLRLGE